MSKLDELIKELCPGGVEYRELQDILKIRNGSDYKSFGEGEYPVYGSGGIMSNVMGSIKVSLPSLEIQNRVANVLDNFDSICNDLNIGLPTEIEARQKQYEYYRDKLLSFKEKKCV